MLPKKNRVTVKEVDTIFKEGVSLSSSSLSFRYLRNEGKETKISFISPKSVAKLAVKRNLLKRHGYRALVKHVALFPLGITGVFVFKKYQEDVLTLENEIKGILNKIN